VRRPIAVVAVAGLVVWAAGPGRDARADGPRFGVLNLTPAAESGRVLAEVEREFQRLNPGARPMEDVTMRRVLATGEGPGDAGVRLLAEAERSLEASDCQKAMEFASEAEPLILSWLTFDEERQLVKKLYQTQVVCGLRLGQKDRLGVAARRLRALASARPDDLPQEIWDAHVVGAVPPAPTLELEVDSEPPNAQIQLDFHAEGVTPRTLKVAPGPLVVEVQKDGYRKAFRMLDIKGPSRTVFRLIERTHDRVDQARTQVALLQKGTTPIEERPLTLARVAQLVRVETLVAMATAGDRVRIYFFDAERGGLSKVVVDSAFDPATGKVHDLARRKTPGAVAPAPDPARAEGAGRPAPSGSPAAAPAPEVGGLPEAQGASATAAGPSKRKKPGPPWWAWLIAGTVAASFFAFVYADRPQESPTVGVRTLWFPPDG
jgi:hypothetical protein